MDTLIDILRTLLRHRYKLVIMPLLTMTLIFYFTRNLPQQYKTEARLYLNLQEGKGLSLADEDLKQYQVHSYFQNTVELLKSKRTLERVRIKAIELALAPTPNYFHHGNEKLIAKRAEVEQKLMALQVGETLSPDDSAAQLMIQFLHYHHLLDDGIRNTILAFRVMDSNFMKVELTAEHPEKAKLLAELFIEALVEENRSLAKNKIKGHKEIIEGLVRQAKEDLDTKIKRLEQFKSTNTIINLGEHTKAIVVYLVQLEGQRANLMARVAASSRGKQEVLATVQSGNEVSLDLSGHDEILKLKNELKELNRSALVNSFRDQKVADQKSIESNIEKTKAAIQQKLLELARKTPYDPSQFQLDLAGRFLNYDLDAETSADMIDIINSEIQRVNQYSKRFAPFESTIGAYEQEISTANHVYLTLLNKLNLTESMEYGSGENVIDVIDTPILPAKPQPSKRWIMIIAGGLAVFVLLAAVFIILHLLDATIRSVEKLKMHTSLPILGAIPQTTNLKDDVLQSAWTAVENQQWMQMAQLILNRCQGEENVLLITSAFGEQGQNSIALKMKQFLHEANLRVALVQANCTLQQNLPEADVNFNDWLENEKLIANREKVINEIKRLKKENDIVLVVPTPMDQPATTHFWMEQGNHLLLAFKANRIFTKMDKRAEELIQHSPISFLGNVLLDVYPESMEDFLGGLPNKKSKIRKWIKKIMTRNLQ
ncbi:MAG: Wzz/FepE/Etk N-terminal domain-containing protein [Cyclobacteriaceae bacterium]|nr:Wzz/FepE/Etk N-terminal domain-containing protein [Cyclobacteriaceae bacterium]